MSNLPLEPGPALAAFAAIAILSTLLLWPRHGLVARVIKRLRTTDRVLTEDALKLLFHRSGPVRPEAVEAALALPRGRLERVLGRLLASGLITVREGELSLSEGGRAYALHIVRAHRLWERYLADRTGVPMSQWHSEADLKEHVLSPAETERLYERMGRPVLDPHGDPIPSERGEIADLGGQPLARLAAGRAVEIVHLEDEPDESYQRLLDAGLSVGDRLTVTGSDAESIRVRSAGRDSTLARADAEGVTVRDVEDKRAGAAPLTLADAGAGETVVVMGLAPACHGPERRRLLDLGIVPDTAITAEMTSALGEPIAFRVRGALIALRRHQASWVLVRREEGREAA